MWLLFDGRKDVKEGGSLEIGLNVCLNDQQDRSRSPISRFLLSTAKSYVQEITMKIDLGDDTQDILHSSWFGDSLTPSHSTKSLISAICPALTIVVNKMTCLHQIAVKLTIGKFWIYCSEQPTNHKALNIDSISSKRKNLFVP
jgi:hypothetical protein